MLSNLRARLLLIAGLVLLSLWVLNTRGIAYGLDLRGGTQLTLAVRDSAGVLTSEQREDAIDRTLRVIRSRVDALGVAEPSILKSGRDRILVELPGATQEEQRRAREVLERTAFLRFQIVRPAADLEPVMQRIDRAAAGVSVEPMSPDPSPPAVFDTIFTPGSRDTGGQPPEADPAGVLETASRGPFSDRLHPAYAGGEGIFLVAEYEAPLVEQFLASPQVLQTLPRGLVLRWGVPERPIVDGYRALYLLDANEMITGEYLVDAQAQRDEMGQPIVGFEFGRRGGRLFEEATGRNVGRLMAIVLDESVMSAPIIQEPIGSRGRITMGEGSIAEARDLALVLRAGALPVPIEVIEERSVGPSLGQDSVDRGRIAGIIGLALVVVIILVYYRLSGAMAIAALAIYVLFVLAGLAAVGAKLSLPGIAGLILSIGMAVDANVLIFERVREELDEGQSPRTSVNRGFGNALSAIVDAQITTLLTAFVLFYLGGAGPVRGFAVTLTIGIIASMFTAIYVTKTFMLIYLERIPANTELSI